MKNAEVLGRQCVPAPKVSLPIRPTRVMSPALDLDHNSKIGIEKIDAREEGVAIADRHLPIGPGQTVSTQKL
jgi:hypothetical protein